MKKKNFKIALLIFIFIFFISLNIDIKNKALTHYGNNDKEDDYYSYRNPQTQSPINSSSNWWNSLYNYRTSINITNINTKKLPKGYSVNISVNTAKLITEGKLRIDGNDLRIVWYNSSNKACLELDRVNESYFNTFDTRIWFKVQDIIDPGMSDTNYYLYYGNPNAFSPPMNKSKIYDFYDDFTQPDGIADGWTSLSGNWEVIDKEYQENSSLLDITSLLNSYTVTNSSIEVRVKTNGTSFGVGVKFRYESETNFFCAGLGYWDKEISFGKRNISGWTEIAFDGVDESNLVSDQWYKLKIESIGTHHKIYLDDILRIDTTHNDHLNNNGIGFLTWSTNTSFYDDLKIRLLMSPEPTLTLGNEEIYRHSSEDFLYYKIFTIDSSKVIGSTNLKDFPLLISIKDSDLRHHCQPDGDDIVFSNGTVWLDHEIEFFDQTFNTTHAKLIAWIRIPSLSPTTDTNITMYYGNPGINTQKNPLGVWDDNYKGVWHLSEDPTGTIYDSTLNNNDGTSYGSMSSGDQVSGKIDGSIEFDGDDDYIDCGNENSLDITGDITIEFWVNGVSFSNDLDPDILTKGSYTQAYSTWINDDGAVYFQLNGDSLFSSSKLSLGEWYSVVCVRSGTNRMIYINGTEDISDTFSPAIETITETLTIARSPDNLNGTLDEIRLSNVARSANWIITEYNNQYDPKSFYSVGKENSVHKYLPNEKYFANYKVITINHTQVAGVGVLANYPLLLSIIDSDLRNEVQTDGYDIAFAKDNVWLAHEIEVFNFTYSPTESQLITWINIPFLSGTNDTQFRMYYGNSTMGTQENPTKVWDTNFVGVWHLKESGTGAINEYIDSSQFSNHGQGGLGNVTYVPNRTAGPIGFGQDFSDHFIDCGNHTSLDITGNQITMQLWMNFPSTHPWMGPFNHKGFYDGYRLIMSVNSQYLRFQLPGDESDLQTSQMISPNTWHHVVATYNGNLMKIYIDGIPDPANLSKINNIESALPYPFRIGHADHPEGVAWTYPWLGQIDEVRISTVARSANWIATEYNNQFNPNNFYSIGSQVSNDITPPEITINEPISNELFGFSAPTYNLTVIDANLDSIWYSLNDGANSTPISAIGAIDETMWDALGNGTVVIRFYANDTFGNLNFVETTVLKDILSPIMSIIEPNNYDLFGNAPPYVNLSITDGNLNQIWYQLENTSIITSNYTWEGVISQSVWDQIGNGSVIIRFFANDTIGNLGYAEAIVYKDIYLPIITIINPNLNEVYNTMAPSFIVSISGSNLDSTWYTLNNGVTNFTFTGLTGSIDQLTWTSRADGTVTIKFYINNTLGVLGYDEVDVIKDTIAPQITLNLPLNNTYCGNEPIINALVTDANLDIIWYQVNTSYVLLANNMNQQLETSIWSSLLEGEFFIYIYANDSARNLSDPLILRLYKDTNAPSAPNLISFPQGAVSGNLLFEWEEGSDPSGILKYRLIIDNEANPFVTPGFVFETNTTGASYTFTGTLQPGTYYFFLYQIDGAGHQSSASTGSFSISSTTTPPEFPLWIIFIIIGAAVGGVIGIIVLKKSKSKKEVVPQIPEKKPIAKIVQEVPEEISQLDYDILKVMSYNELIGREENLLEYIRHLEETKKYGKAAEFIGELILIEEILGNSQEVELYHQKQIDVAIKGLEYLKDQYEIESKKAALSGDYSKALELYNESKVISDNLKGYMERQQSSDTELSDKIATMEPQPIVAEVEIVYSCMNDLLTKYFDDIGIKYYSNPQIYDNIPDTIHGLIFADQLQLEDIDPMIRERIKSIQIIFTEDLSNEKVTKLCQIFHNPYILLVIVGIKWPKNIEAQIIEIPPNIGVKYKENVKIIHHELFITLIGLKGAYQTAFKEIIDLYNKSEIEILRETQESSEVIIHSTDELRYDLKEKGLITDKLEEYFKR